MKKIFGVIAMMVILTGLFASNAPNVALCHVEYDNIFDEMYWNDVETMNDAWLCDFAENVFDDAFTMDRDTFVMVICNVDNVSKALKDRVLALEGKQLDELTLYLRIKFLTIVEALVFVSPADSTIKGLLGEAVRAFQGDFEYYLNMYFDIIATN